MEINVHIGQIRIAKNGETLQALLGSCVGIGLIWKRQGLVGLAHCLLPHAEKRSGEGEGRFVDQAIPTLVALMGINIIDRHEIEAVLVGGGNMNNLITNSKSRLIGDMNVHAAERALKKHGLETTHKDVLGDEGRRLSLSCRDGITDVRIEKIPRLKAG